MAAIRITSDGTAAGTRITAPDGTRLRGVTNLVIEVRGGRNQIVKATLTFEDVILDLTAQVDL